MRTLWPIGAAIAALCFVLAVTLTPAKAATHAPDQVQPSGFTLQQEVEIVTLGSGVGVLRQCALKFQQPKFEVTAKAIFFNILGPLFDPANAPGGRRDRLANYTLKAFAIGNSDGVWRSAKWNETTQEWDAVTLATDTIEACEALDDTLRDTVTAPGNIYNSGPVLKEYSDGDA